jgi:3-dehydroquinate dehydratase
MANILVINNPNLSLLGSLRRETFRQHSYFSDIAIRTITGLIAAGYFNALRYAHSYLTKNVFIRS